MKQKQITKKELNNRVTALMEKQADRTTITRKDGTIAYQYSDGRIEEIRT